MKYVTFIYNLLFPLLISSYGEVHILFESCLLILWCLFGWTTRQLFYQGSKDSFVLSIDLLVKTKELDKELKQCTLRL